MIPFDGKGRGGTLEPTTAAGRASTCDALPGTDECATLQESEATSNREA